MKILHGPATVSEELLPKSHWSNKTEKAEEAMRRKSGDLLEGCLRSGIGRMPEIALSCG